MRVDVVWVVRQRLASRWHILNIRYTILALQWIGLGRVDLDLTPA